MPHRPLAAALALCAMVQAGLVACSGRSPTPAALPGGAPVAAGDAAAVLSSPRMAGTKVAITPRGIVVPVLEVGDDGWRVSTPCGREAVVPTAAPVRHVTVVLDPGHGGWDPGAVGASGLSEAAVNLAVAEYAKAALEEAGQSVLLTRTADYGMSLANRARLARDLEAEAFVSVHHNAEAWTPSDRPGSETYYQQQSEDSKRLAGLVYEEVFAALSAYPIQWVTAAGAGATWRTRTRDGDDYYAMVRLPRPVPATLVEAAYISNPAEATLLARPDVQRAEGEAVMRGVLRYLLTDDPGSGYVEGGVVPPRPRGPGRRGSDEDRCDDPEL